MSERERLADHLRFGPMAQVMRGWTEAQRMWLCEQMADDLLASGWKIEWPWHGPGAA